EIVGHEARWTALVRAFAKDSVPQTLLISGARHVGKTTLAKRFAKLLLCPQRVEIEGLPEPCGKCRTCHQIDIETFPDFRIFRPIVSSAKEERDWVTAPEDLEGSILTVDVARKFGDEAIRRPMIGARKVMVLAQAERMNIEAQNSLLKTFEEPARGLTIILLTENARELLPTVLSRCWHLPLGLAHDDATQSWLGRTFPAVAPAVLQEAVAVAGGRPGAAWREIERLARGGEETMPRFAQMTQLVARIEKSQPVGALGLTEETLRLAKEWWAEDHADGDKTGKKGDAKVVRSSVVRVLDELAIAYRARWKAAIAGAQGAEAFAVGLDQIRKTRHYILRNANTNLALDVLFGRLIALNSGTTLGPRR
ncbi:MAG TPA: hypothetical protein VF719_01835, partial [Abditibacteriaceae bacterium]